MPWSALVVCEHCGGSKRLLNNFKPGEQTCLCGTLMRPVLYSYDIETALEYGKETITYIREQLSRWENYKPPPELAQWRPGEFID
jgi:hypothetical protein